MAALRKARLADKEPNGRRQETVKVEGPIGRTTSPHFNFAPSSPTSLLIFLYNCFTSKGNRTFCALHATSNTMHKSMEVGPNSES
jgi:hypothetical protein